MRQFRRDRARGHGLLGEIVTIGLASPIWVGGHNQRVDERAGGSLGHEDILVLRVLDAGDLTNGWRMSKPFGSTAGGTEKLSRSGQQSPTCCTASGGQGRRLPRMVSLGAQVPESGSGDQVGPEMKDVEDNGKAGKEPSG